MKLFYKLVLILISTPMLSYAQGAACHIPEKINFTTSADGARVAKLDLQQDWETADVSKAAAISNFKNKVSSITSVDQKYLINRQKVFFKNFPDIVKRMTRINDGQFGRIDEAGCLETSVLSAILTEYSEQVEFAVYILKEGADQRQKFRAYVITWGMDHVEESQDLNLLIDQDLKEGWQYYAQLHNHPFYLNNITGDIAGTVVPSEPDFTFYLDHQKLRGLQNAWVTNGFNTFKLNSPDFNKF